MSHRTSVRYIIRFTGLFESGFVKFALFSKSSEHPISGATAGHSWATKFRWRWVANVACRIMNAGDDKLRTYTVEGITPNPANI